MQVDYQLLLDRVAELKDEYRGYMWMMAISAGGKIRIPRGVRRDVEDRGDLLIEEDPATGELIVTATLYSPDLEGVPNELR